MKLKVKRLHPASQLPKYGHSGDAGLDLFANENVILEPGKAKAVKTGIAVEIPCESVGLIWDRSGLATKSKITTMAGVIDSNYRGEVEVVMLNTGDQDYSVIVGDRIAQMLVQPVYAVDVAEVDELQESSRGANGFGSSGR